MSAATLGAEPAAAAADVPATASPRVLFVNHSSRMGGAEFILLSNLQAFDHRSTVWLFEDGLLRNALAREAVRTVLAPGQSNFGAVKRDMSLLRALPMAAGMVRMAIGIAVAARRHDVIYANSQKAFVLSALASLVSGRPLIWHLHDILTPAHFGKAQLRLVRLLARAATRVIVPSTHAAEAFIRLGGDKSRLAVVWNGVSLPPSHVGSEGRAALRSRLGLPGGFLCGVFSRLAPWKGQAVLLDAVARSPDTSCIVVGSALFGETEFAAALQRQVRDAGLAGRVHFLGQRDDVLDLMRAVDVVVHPSTDPEPFGRTLVEAMLCRTPVIATCTGASAEILNHGACGLLVPPNDPAALSHAITQVRMQPADAHERTNRAEARAEALFSEARMQAEILEFVRVTVHHRQAS